MPVALRLERRKIAVNGKILYMKTFDVRSRKE